jgi:phosphate/phosphite/phosphonate ABC transporter binding protein
VGVRQTWGFGMARSHAVVSMRARFEELCAIVSKVMSLEIRPQIAGSYAELVSAMRGGELGVAWMPPLLALELEDDRIAYPLALPLRDGRTAYHSALIVREAGPRSLEELHARRAAWLHRESTSGYVVPRLHLMSAGYDVANFFSQETFYRSHFEVVNAVMAGDADVGATFINFDPVTQKVRAAGWTAADGKWIRPVRVLETIGPIPNDSIVAASALPSVARLHMKSWLLAPDARAKELFGELLGTESFRIGDDAHYRPLRNMITRARVHGFLS